MGIVNYTHNRSLVGTYEEGTFTPLLTAATPPTSVPTGSGVYTKIGNLCYFAIRFVSVDTSGGSGAMKVTGLPFTIAGAVGDRGNVMACMLYGLEVSNTVANVDGATPLTIQFQNLADDASWAATQLTAGIGKWLQVSGCYRTT
jgi:hypothetical protein